MAWTVPTSRSTGDLITASIYNTDLVDNLNYLKSLADGKVALTGNETVAGVKTFSSFPVTPSSAPTTNYQVANKKYVDDSGMAHISTTTLSSDGTFSFTSIPSTYKILAIFGELRSDRTGSYIDSLMMRLNNDSGANYYQHQIKADGATVSTGYQDSQTELPSATIGTDDCDSNSATSIGMYIYNYTSTSTWKSVLMLTQIHYSDGTSGNIRVLSRGGLWKSTSATNRIDLFPNAGTNFKSGSKVSLYGIK